MFTGGETERETSLAFLVGTISMKIIVLPADEVDPTFWAPCR